ncbi:MAG TPA: hypothetical protein VER33_24400 [Polyangiaceae bacterium]|nr:hypothetical protein [Polyangiaceae bacterium]
MAAGVTLSFSLGCSVEANSSTEPDGAATVETSEDGLLLESTSIEGGLRGSFVSQGRTIHFAAIRGEKNPTDALDPSPPEYAIDARFADADGHSIIVSGGGAQLTQEGWETDGAGTDPEARTLDISVLPRVVDALRAAELPDNLTLELQTLVELGESVRDAQLVVKPEGQVAQACTPAYQHEMRFRNKAAFGIAGNHTAVRLDSWYLNSACTWIYQGWAQSCNHGTCAADRAMTDFCYWVSPMRSYAWPVFQRHSAGSSACSSPYNAFSMGGAHNCNDATYFQGYNIRLNTSYSTATGPHNICVDSTWHLYSPSCTGARGASF